MIPYRRAFKALIHACALLGLALITLSTAYAQTEDEIPNNELRLFQSEWAFRRNALHKVMPEFPEEALKAGAQGVVVLSLYQDGEGRASYIKALESPHPAITKATIAAVEQWRWRKFAARGLPRPVRGKLTFYFVIERGVGRVENPRIIVEEEKKKRSS